MPHPTLDNQTPFAVETLFLLDERGRSLLAVVVKGTFDIAAWGALCLSEQQPAVCVGGDVWEEVDGEPCYRLEPEIAPFKLATDVAVVAHATAPEGGTTQLDVGVRVGPVSQGARVFGDRLWCPSAGGVVLSRPQPFHRIPLSFARAFGGWDRSHPDPTLHEVEPRNPVGRGFFARDFRLQAPRPAPNIEALDCPIRAHTDRPPPAGFGFVSPNWQPRRQLAGTYDEAWQASRCPLLPEDFDPRFYNAAAPGLVMPGFLVGDELIATVGLAPEGALAFRLPGVPPPGVRVALYGEPDALPEMRLDTVVVDMDARQVSLTWRGWVPLSDGPPDVRVVAIHCPAAHALPRAFPSTRAVVPENLSA